MNNQWISIKEGNYPKNGELVIAYVSYGPDVEKWASRVIPVYHNKYGWWHPGGIWGREIEVTHWMPMPEPPEE